MENRRAGLLAAFLRERGLARWVRFEGHFGAKFDKCSKYELFLDFRVDRKSRKRTMESEPRRVKEFANMGLLVGETKWQRFSTNVGSV